MAATPIKISDPSLTTPTDYTKVLMELFEQNLDGDYEVRKEEALDFLQIAIDAVVDGADVDYDTLVKIQGFIQDLDADLIQLSEVVKNLASASMETSYGIGMVPLGEVRRTISVIAPSNNTELIDVNLTNNTIDLKKKEVRYQGQAAITVKAHGNPDKTLTLRVYLASDDSLLTTKIYNIEGGNNEISNLAPPPSYLDTTVDNTELYVTLEPSDGELEIMEYVTAWTVQGGSGVTLEEGYGVDISGNVIRSHPYNVNNLTSKYNHTDVATVNPTEFHFDQLLPNVATQLYIGNTINVCNKSIISNTFQYIGEGSLIKFKQSETTDNDDPVFYAEYEVSAVASISNGYVLAIVYKQGDVLSIADFDGKYVGIEIINAGGGGGHEYRENDTPVTQEAARNIITNGSKVVLEDNATNGETKEYQYFENGVDVAPAGKADGDLWQYNETTEKSEPVATAPLMIQEIVNEAGVNTDKELSTFIPAGYKVLAVTAQEYAGFNAGVVHIGITSLGTEVATNTALTANGDTEMEVNHGYHSKVNDTALYVSSSAWGTGVIQLNFVMQKVN